MAALNQAKIINDLEQIGAGPKDDFIYGFLSAYGTPKATINRLRIGDRQRSVASVPGDMAVPQKLYFRAVAQGISVADTLDEILALPTLKQHKIRFVLVTDFVTVMAYDLKVKDGTEFDFAELKLNYEFFLPLTGKYEKAVEHAEHPADVKACEKMGRLYDSICAVNAYGKDDLHALNVFLTRLLFCFFAEDTAIFPQSNQMTLAVKSLTQEDGSDLADFFAKLFLALNLPNDAPERRRLPVTFQKFPYVNGGLFLEQVPIPQFDKRSRRLLLECGGMQWNDISPVIFGSMFQAVMDPERRRSMGAHYTSEKNILKVVRPLFLDALHEEFEQIKALKKGKKAALQAFHTKLGSLGFLDPACGCGNFLVVSFRELKELELQVVLALRDEKDEGPAKSLVFDVKMLSKVSINQFYGIEIEEFPVEIARVSMWLMEHVMNVKFGKSLGLVIPSIPLLHSAEIVCVNALTTPWESVVAPEKLHYILGNPPFVGGKRMNSEQRKDMEFVFGKMRLLNSIDYVTAWYKKSTGYMKNTTIRSAFVSSNSICQGQQIPVFWQNLDKEGVCINFAYRTFDWSNEAKHNAAVFCVIIGFSFVNGGIKKIFYSNDKDKSHVMKVVNSINYYLLDSENIFIDKRSSAICNVSKCYFGNMPNDGGNLILNEAEKQDLISNYPESSRFIKRYIGADDFLNSNVVRYCLWLKNIEKSDWKAVPPIAQRVESVRKFRLSSTAQPTREKANTPELFFFAPHTGSPYLIIPSVSSERRNYIPIGFLPGDVIASNLSLIIPDATLYHFGILTSAMHMAWMRTVCGRLEMRYRYSASIVYNTFPWPKATKQQEKAIEALAQAVLDTRERYPDMTLAQLYDPDTMPPPLQEAHAALNLAVDRLYQAKPFADDEQRLQLLFKLYAKLAAQKPAAESDEEEEGDND